MGNYKYKADSIAEQMKPLRVGKRVKYISYHGIWTGTIAIRHNGRQGIGVTVWLDKEHHSDYGDSVRVNVNHIKFLEVIKREGDNE